MKNKIEDIKNNPAFQKSVDSMRPTKSILGLLSIVLFFFVPEIMNYFYHNEITLWLDDFASNSPIPLLGEQLTKLTHELFTGEVSWFNIGLGFLFLLWLLKNGK